MSISLTKSKKRWVIDPDAIDRAQDQLGLQHTVTIEFKESSWWWGSYRGLPLHLIWVNPNQPKFDASRTIWHELIHALQLERDYGCDSDAWTADCNRFYYRSGLIDMNGDPIIVNQNEWFRRYYAIPFEQEAENGATGYGHKYPLVKFIA